MDIGKGDMVVCVDATNSGILQDLLVEGKVYEVTKATDSGHDGHCRYCGDRSPRHLFIVPDNMVSFNPIVGTSLPCLY